MPTSLESKKKLVLIRPVGDMYDPPEDFYKRNSVFVSGGRLLDEAVSVTEKLMSNWTFNCKRFTEVVNVTRYLVPSTPGETPSVDLTQTITTEGFMAPSQILDPYLNPVYPTDDGLPKVWHELISSPNGLFLRDGANPSTPTHADMRGPRDITYEGDYTGGPLMEGRYTPRLPFCYIAGTPTTYLPIDGVYDRSSSGFEYGDVWHSSSITDTVLEASGSRYLLGPGYVYKRFDFDVRTEITTHFALP